MQSALLLQIAQAAQAVFCHPRPAHLDVVYSRDEVAALYFKQPPFFTLYRKISRTYILKTSTSKCQSNQRDHCHEAQRSSIRKPQILKLLDTQSPKSLNPSREAHFEFLFPFDSSFFSLPSVCRALAPKSPNSSASGHTAEAQMLRAVCKVYRLSFLILGRGFDLLTTWLHDKLIAG